MRRSIEAALLSIVILAPAFVSATHAQEPAGRGRKFALLVGVRQYQTPALRPLAYSDRDVEELAKVLVDVGYDRDDIRVLTQERAARELRSLPTAHNIRTELARLLKLVELRDNPADALIVALAGHGIMDPKSQSSYFCPADVGTQDLSPDDPALIDLGRLYDQLQGSRAGFKLLLVDACRNDPLNPRRAVRPVVDLVSVTRPLKRRTPGGVAALFSCSEGQVAYEDDDLKHGVFFHFVIEGLRGQADADGNGTIMLGELASYTSTEVFRFVDRTRNDEQVPEYVFKANLVPLVDLKRPQTARSPATKSESRPSQVDQSKAELASRTSPSEMPRPSAPEPGKLITSSIGMKLVLIPAGEFEMGSPDDDEDAERNEKPRHRVRITRPFYLGATEVTQGEYEQVMGQNPSKFSAQGDYSQDVTGQDTRRLPVENVSWNDAIAFCNKLSERDGLAPYYQFGTKTIWGGDGYHLPTEAEWEYACRAGSTTRYSFGDDAAGLGEYAWYRGNSGEKPHPVGQKLPNAFGLYDMHGNVWEWCWDRFQVHYYKESTVSDPSGPLQATRRVYRGGGWYHIPSNARSAYRLENAPAFRNFVVGFRVARVQSDR